MAVIAFWRLVEKQKDLESCDLVHEAPLYLSFLMSPALNSDGKQPSLNRTKRGAGRLEERQLVSIGKRDAPCGVLETVSKGKMSAGSYTFARADGVGG